MAELMTTHFDARETRSADERASDLSRELPALIAHARQRSGFFNNSLHDVNASSITTEASLSDLPIVRKSDMVARREIHFRFGILLAFLLNHFIQFINHRGLYMKQACVI